MKANERGMIIGEGACCGHPSAIAKRGVAAKPRRGPGYSMRRRASYMVRSFRPSWAR